MTIDDRPLFSHLDELEEEIVNPTGAMPTHETRPDDSSLGAGVMASGGTATDTGTGLNATPGATARQDLETPLFGSRDEPTIGSEWADEAVAGQGERDDRDRRDDAFDR